MARILYFSRDYTPHDHRFLSAICKAGHQAYYLQLERRGHALEDRPVPPGVEHIPWAGGQHPARLKDAPRLLGDFKRVIRQVRPDLVQAGPLQTAALLAAASGFRPLISMSWGYDLLVDADRGPLWRWATRFTLGHSAAMLGDCETIRQRAVAFGMPADKIIAFPWGVDLKHFTPEGEASFSDLDGSAASGQADAFILLSTRGWEPIYGVDLIARAFCQVAPGRPELYLLMLGNGSQAAALRRMFMQAGVLERVFTPGQVGLADLPRYYRSADLYISASHSDGSSISLLEAMACGRPVLVSDIPGNREWVTPGQQGWWFRDGDVGDLVLGITRALEQRQRLPDMGRQARCKAESGADWEANFPKLLQVYEQVGKQN